MFKDHFSGHANLYSSARPTYPDALFEYLVTQVKHRDLAWDCATGNGQAALKLAPYFKSVIATDGSQTQLAAAKSGPNIEYRVAMAEESGIDSGSVDLITVAQAVHWFDFDKFYAEARRVLKPDGIIAIWCYGLFHTDNTEVNALLHTFYEDIIGPFWPPERNYIDEHYATLPFPFKTISNIPSFSIVTHWNSQQIIDYLNTWSSVKAYEKQLNENPVESWFISRLSACINDKDVSLIVTFPLRLKMGYR